MITPRTVILVTFAALALILIPACGGSGGSSEVCISTQDGVQCGEGNRQDSPDNSNNDNSSEQDNSR